MNHSKISEVINSPLYRLAAFLSLLGLLLYGYAHYVRFDATDAAKLFAKDISQSATANQLDNLEIYNAFIAKVASLNAHNFIHDLLIHATIACYIAALLIIVVELRVKKLNQYEMDEMRQEIASNVWKALSNRILPPSITNQIGNVLNQDFTKNNLECTLTLSPISGTFDDAAFSGKENEFIVVKAETKYNVKNISAKSLKYDFATNLRSQHPDAMKIQVGNEMEIYPRHCSLHVNGKQIAITNYHADLSHMSEPMPAGTAIEIRHVAEQIYRTSDLLFYAEMRPVDGYTLSIHNQIGRRVKIKDAYLTHPMTEGFEPDPAYEDRQADYENLRWHFGGGLLPGHTVLVMWEAI